ncbi:MAG: Stp1/IreP family PP2C-type Ser/Thr phosphatase [Acidimicrobiales bacterium]
MTALRSGSASDVGRVRTVNEDLAIDGGPLYGVADGMGGHAGGDVAARTAVDALESAFRRQPTVEGFLAAVQQANKAVWDRGRSEWDLRGMGTTLTVAALIKDPDTETDRLALVNVGDSRAYLLRDGRLEQLTTDHSVAEELVTRGELTPDQAAQHPQRHILTRALGVAPAVEVDAWELVPQAGDRYLLCSDGLSNEVDDRIITRILGSGDSPSQTAEELVSAANEEGGNDNITVVVLDVVESEGRGDLPPAAASLANGEGAGSGPPPVPLTHSAMLAGSPATRSSASSTAGTSDPRSKVVEQDGESGSGGVLVEAPSGEATKVVRDHWATRLWRRREPTTERSPRLVTGRLVVFLLAVAVVLAAAWGLIRWYLDSSYFLAVQGSQIVVDQGKPGGFLWFDPNTVERTGVTTAEIPANQLQGLENGTYSESSPAAARALVRRMVITECEYDQGIYGDTTTTAPSASLPAIARCPTVQQPVVTSPPTTSSPSTTFKRSSTSSTVAGGRGAGTTTTEQKGVTG